MKGARSTQRDIYNEFRGTTGRVKDLNVRKLLDKIIDRAHSHKILDVGCGDGHVLESFVKDHECYGIDISSELLKHARKRGIKTFLIDLEANKFPFSSDYFDVVVCSEVIEHLIDPDNMLYEINRVLKQKGYFILTFPNINQPISLLIQILLDLPPLYSARYKCPHVRDYSLRIAEWSIREFGFEVVKITGSHIYPFENRLSRWLAEKIPRLGEKIIIASRKERCPNERLRETKVIWSQREFLRERTVMD